VIVQNNKARNHYPKRVSDEKWKEVKKELKWKQYGTQQVAGKKNQKLKEKTTKPKKKAKDSVVPSAEPPQQARRCPSNQLDRELTYSAFRRRRSGPEPIERSGWRPSSAKPPFEFGLPEAMWREFELQGKVELSRADKHLLSLTKLVHLVGIPLMTLLFMAAAQYDPDGLIIILTAAAPWACAGFVALLQPALSSATRIQPRTD
jgi:hypothetical protein